MATPTSTRRALRDKIAYRLNMEFYKLYGGSATLDSSNATLDKLIDSGLTQRDDYWNSRWLFVPTTGDTRRVVDFIENENALFVDRPLSASPNAVEYQLFDIHSPYEIHGAINDAIQDGYRTFFGLQTDDDALVVQEDTLEYSLSNLTQTPWKIYNVWLEQPHSVTRGNPTSAGSATLTDSGKNFETIGVEAGWRVSIYGETGAGQVRTVSSVSGGELTLSSAWTTQPDTTSKYSVWNPSEQLQDWRQLLAVRFDNPEFPTKMYLMNRYSGYVGMRIRVQYSYRPSALSAESDTTPVPSEFVVPRALYELFRSRIRNTKIDRSIYASEAENFRVEAEEKRQSQAPSEPAMTIWSYEDPRDAPGGPPENPMGWG